MDRSASAAVCVGVAIEIEEDTPREASQAKNEAEYNESTVTESEGTISQLHHHVLNEGPIFVRLKYCRSQSNIKMNMGSVSKLEAYCILLDRSLVKLIIGL